MSKIFSLALLALVGCSSMTARTKDSSRAAADGLRTSMFQGVKANTGTAVARLEGGKLVLSVSDDFVVPDTPAPHWQVVDSKGNVYLLQRFDIKGGKVNRTVTVPSYVRDVTKVQVWCAFAETLLGEASFPKTVRR